MAEGNNFSFEEWKQYLKTDKDMNRRWRSLVDVGENVSEDLKKTLEALPKAEASKRRRELTALNIFNALNNTKQKLDFSWHKKTIWNDDDQRREYVVECFSPSSDFIFNKIKEYRGVVSMHGASINKYLQPVANKIWALKEAKKVSVKPEVDPSKISYKSLKTKKIGKVVEKKEDKISDNNAVASQDLKGNDSGTEGYTQLEIKFPGDDQDESKGDDSSTKTEDEELDELYKFDPEKEKYWNR